MRARAADRVVAIATAALVLSISLLSGDDPTNIWLLRISWVALLITVFSGIGFIRWYADVIAWSGLYSMTSVRVLSWLMFISFGIGMGSLTLFAWVSVERFTWNRLKTNFNPLDLG